MDKKTADRLAKKIVDKNPALKKLKVPAMVNSIVKLAQV